MSKIKVSVHASTGCRHSVSEDAHLTERYEDLLICGVADGRSGARFARKGAESVLSCVSGYIHAEGFERCFSEHSATIAGIWLAIHTELNRLSQIYESEVEDFASTLVLIAIKPSTGENIMVHIGDGIICGLDRTGHVFILSEPENGLSRSETWVTSAEELISHIRVHRGSIHRLKRILISTDGADALCIGRRMLSAAYRIFAEGTQEELGTYLDGFEAIDDATVMDLMIAAE